MSIDSKQDRIRQKIKKGTLEVEDILNLASLNDPRFLPLLREVQQKFELTDSEAAGNLRVVPLGRWAEVVCTYLDGGCDAVAEYGRRSRKASFYFAVSLLEEIKTEQSVSILAEFCGEVVTDLPERIPDAVLLASAINLVLSFKNAPVVSIETKKIIREFLHKLLELNLKEAEVALVVCALRGVGDEQSVKLIGELPKFGGAWSGLETTACRAIRKRLKSSS